MTHTSDPVPDRDHIPATIDNAITDLHIPDAMRWTPSSNTNRDQREAIDAHAWQDILDAWHDTLDTWRDGPLAALTKAFTEDITDIRDSGELTP